MWSFVSLEKCRTSARYFTFLSDLMLLSANKITKPVHKRCWILEVVFWYTTRSKMADSSVQRDSISHTLSERSGNIGYNLNCIKCSEYESQLCEVLNELGSAPKIIEILQKELSIYSSNNVCGNALVQSKVSSKPVNSSECTPVPARNSSQNQNKSNKHTNVNSAQTISTANRFSLLSNLQVDSMILHGPYEQRKPSSLQNCFRHQGSS